MILANAKSTLRITALALLGAALSLSAPMLASAQDVSPADPTTVETLPQASLPSLNTGERVENRQRNRASSRGLNLNLGASSMDMSGFDVSVPRLDLPAEAVGSTLFKLDLSDTSCLTSGQSCASRADRFGLGLSKPISIKSNDDGIDLVLRPRANFRFDDDSSSALVGAVVEIGEDLREGSDLRPKTWYLFAGADAEALTYSPDGISRLSSGQFHLQDRIIVGDAQAGLGYRIGDADVSLSYLRREAQAEGISYNEDAAALSFTWKR